MPRCYAFCHMPAVLRCWLILRAPFAYARTCLSCFLLDPTTGPSCYLCTHTVYAAVRCTPRLFVVPIRCSGSRTPYYLSSRKMNISVTHCRCNIFVRRALPRIASLRAVCTRAPACAVLCAPLYRLSRRCDIALSPLLLEEGKKKKNIWESYLIAGFSAHCIVFGLGRIVVNGRR